MRNHESQLDTGQRVPMGTLGPPRVRSQAQKAVARTPLGFGEEALNPPGPGLGPHLISLMRDSEPPAPAL